MALNEKQKRFCEEYIQHLDKNLAYCNAGYKTKTKASLYTNSGRLLQNAEVKAYIAELSHQMRHEQELVRNKTIQQLINIVLGDITDVATFDDKGLKLKDSKSLSRNITSAIESVSFSETTKETKEGDTITIIRHNVKMHSKTKAADLLARYTGVTTDINVAIATLQRFGIELKQRKDSGEWYVENYTSSTHP